MPIVTITKNDKTTYYAVTDASEASINSLVSEFKLRDCGSHEYAEYALRKEYLRRLTEHAYECAQLADLVTREPSDEELLSRLKIKERLAEKVARDAVWLRTYDPFTALLAEVVNAPGDYGTHLRIDCSSESEEDVRYVSSLDDHSWDDTEHALWARDPWRRDHFARIAQEKAEKEAAREFPPVAEKRITKAYEAYRGAIDAAQKEKTAAEARKAKRTSKRRAA